MRILLIEDEPTTAEAIERMLAKSSFNVYSTGLGEEGIDLGKRYDYDLFLLDLNLPDLHGYDVLRQLRLAKVRAPVLIVSGSSDLGSKLRGFALGADDYLTKPSSGTSLSLAFILWFVGHGAGRSRSFTSAS